MEYDKLVKYRDKHKDDVIGYRFKYMDIEYTAPYSRFDTGFILQQDGRTIYSVSYNPRTKKLLDIAYLDVRVPSGVATAIYEISEKYCGKSCTYERMNHYFLDMYNAFKNLKGVDQLHLTVFSIKEE